TAQVRGLPVGLALSGRFGAGGRIGNLSEVKDRLHQALNKAVESGRYPDGVAAEASRLFANRRQAVGGQEWGAWLAHGGDEVTIPRQDRVYTVQAKLVLPDLRNGVRELADSPESGGLAPNEVIADTWDQQVDHRAVHSDGRSVGWHGSLSVTFQ